MKDLGGNFRDKNGNAIGINDDVLIPKPNETDLHSYEFTGIVVGFHGDYVTVTDKDEIWFEIKPERLEVID